VEQRLAELAAAHRLRRLEPQPAHVSAPEKSIDFASNDYLQMASHPRLRETLARALETGLPAGAGAARLLRGNDDIIAQCEEHFARWLSAPKCLLTSSGYQANYLLLSSMPQRGDVILYDANVHASMRDGIRASHAQNFKFEHNNLEDLQRLITQNKKAAQIFIVTESLFSMDGDFADIKTLHDIAINHNAMLIIDEAHATGIYGETGKGSAEGYSRDRMITVHTGGKALGAAGGIIAARADIIDYLINTARPFIFATAPMPLLALALKTAIQILDDEPWRRTKLLEICNYAKSESPILSIVLGEDIKAVNAAKNLQQNGYDIRAIRPPTVPEGTARLRVSLNSSHTPKVLDQLFMLLRQV